MTQNATLNPATHTAWLNLAIKLIEIRGVCVGSHLKREDKKIEEWPAPKNFPAAREDYGFWPERSKAA